MTKPFIGTNEQDRLIALRRYHILDTKAERAYDDLTQLASNICETPIALISLVDLERQWFKSRVGLDVDETSRDVSFCAHAIHQQAVFEINDATKDPRFCDNPLVTDSPNIRFYAGAPLVLSDGYVLGTLCVIDRKPKQLNAEQTEALKALARSAVLLLDMRLQVEELREARRSQNTLFDELKAKSDEVAKLYLQKSELIGIAAHDMRGVLSGIYGMADLLLEAESGSVAMNDEEKRSFLTAIHTNGETGLKLLNELLHAENMESPDLKLKCAPIYGHEFCENLRIRNKGQATRKGIRVHFPEIQNFEFVADPMLFLECVDNILNNAIKYSPQGKNIWVAIAKDADGGVTCSVKDEGPGFSEEDKAKAFGRFQRLSALPTGGELSSGLGLSIVKRLVELHEGTITLDSENGNGTKVIIKLPRLHV